MSLGGLRHWMGLSWLQRRVLVRAVVWLGLIDLGLRMFGFRRLMERVPSVPIGPNLRVPAHVGMYATSLEVAARHHVIPAHCLHKSIVLHFWLRLENVPSQLRIGVRMEDKELKAHAWVELGGRVLNDEPQVAAAFRPLLPRRVDKVSWTSRAALTQIASSGVLELEA